VGPRNRVLDEGLDPPCTGRKLLRGRVPAYCNERNVRLPPRANGIRRRHG